MPASPALGVLGVAKETVKGTGVVPTAFVPVAQGRKWKDVVSMVDDEGMRGIMADGPFDQIPGVTWSEFEIPSSPAFADTLPWFLVNILGDYATTGASDPFTHTASLLNSGDGQCKSLSLTDFYGLSGGTPARRFSGMQVSEVGLDWNADGMLTWSSKLLGFLSTQVAKPAQSFTTVNPSPAWECTATIGGAGNLLIEKGSLTFKRDTEPIHTADGTQAPYKIWQGGLSVEGKLSFVMEDDAELTRYLTTTKPIVSLSWSHLEAAKARTIQIVMSKCNYKATEPDHSGKWATYEAEIQALPNTTDVGASGGYSPAKVSFLNALAASTFA